MKTVTILVTAFAAALTAMADTDKTMADILLLSK